MSMGYPLDIIYLLSTIYCLLKTFLAVYSLTLTTVSRAGRGNCLTTGISTNQSSVFTVSTNHSSVFSIVLSVWGTPVFYSLSPETR